LHLPSTLLSRLAILLPLLIGSKLATQALKRRAELRNELSHSDRQELIEELRERVPAPPPYQLGGEVIDSDTYQRFLQVQGWSVSKAAEMLSKDIEWRKKIRPREIQPRNIPTACSQRGWLVLMRHHGSSLLVDVDPQPAVNPAARNTSLDSGVLH